MHQKVIVTIFFSWILGVSQPLISDSSLHRVRNCEIEIEMLKNNVLSQEESRSQLYKEMEERLISAKKAVQEAENTTKEQKQKSATAYKGFQADLTALKEHNNQLSSKINELGALFDALKKEVSTHNGSLKDIEEALSILSKAITPQKTASPSSRVPHIKGAYVVQSGDSLERIARKYKITVKELKELNHLSSSTIRPGQELIVSQAEPTASSTTGSDN
jgi:LysM repeat protein